jgi:DNA-directed RNA polymerase subunit RPC12/RpoP
VITLNASADNFDAKPRTEHPSPDEVINCPGCGVSIKVRKTNCAFLTAADRYTILCYLCPDCGSTVQNGTEAEQTALAEQVNEVVVRLGWVPEGKYV